MKTFLISLILLLPVVAAAQTDNQRQKDSLRTAIAKSAGQEKIKNLSKLSILYFPETADDKKMDTLLTILHQMSDEAVRQGDINKQALALNNILIAYLNRGNYDEIIRLAPGYMAKIDKPEAERRYYNIFKSYFLAYLCKGDYNTALNISKQIYDRAQKDNNKFGMAISFFTMSDLYNRQNRFDEQEKYIRQSVELLKSLGDKYLDKLTEAYFQMCQCLYEQHKYDEALQTAAEFEQMIHHYENILKAKEPLVRYNLYHSYLQIYLGKKDYNRVEIYCNKMDSLSIGRESELVIVNARAKIFNSRKQYDKALQMTDSAMKLTVTAAEQNWVREIKMQIFTDMGRAKDLFSVSQEYINVQDSIRNTEFNKNLDELRTKYEVDKITAQKKREHIYLLVAVAVLLLLAGILTFYIILYRKKKSAYQELVRKSQEWAKAPITVKVTDEQQSVDETDRQLFEQLQTQFQNELLYRNSTINIDELASRMKINKNYISQAINRCTGKNFNAFINEYRVKDAVLMMSDGAQKYSLEGLAFEVGFNDRRTFYNAFKKMTGLSPSEFQNNL